MVTEEERTHVQTNFMNVFEKNSLFRKQKTIHSKTIEN